MINVAKTPIIRINLYALSVEKIILLMKKENAKLVILLALRGKINVSIVGMLQKEELINANIVN